jgi:two-component system phosphate regulon response regulator PhoB
LRERGHDVSETEDAGSALEAVRRNRPDLLICDCVLPDLAGVELLSDVRRNDELKTIRVLMTSNGNQSEDVVHALESGADDFIGKPIQMPEFIARVDACLRRPANLTQSSVVSAGGISIDNVGHRVVVEGEYLSLAPREYRLLLFLLGNQDRVFSRKQLLVHVWDRDSNVGPRTVDVHIRRLRSLLEPFGYDSYFQTIRGSGYRFSLDT